MLGRFLHSLNKFCEEEYGLLFDIPDYSVYEFAKVALLDLRLSLHSVASLAAVLPCGNETGGQGK